MHELGPIAAYSDLLSWRNAFLPLAIVRCQPLLSHAGVPLSIAGAPSRLRRIALQCLENLHRLGSDKVNAATSANILLQEAIATLTTYYDEVPVTGLIEWMERHYLDLDQYIEWRMWRSVMVDLDRFIDGNIPVPIALDAETLHRVHDTIHSALGQKARDHYHELVRLASMSPLQPEERSLVALEQLRPGDAPEVDVLGALELVIGNQRAYDVWQDMAQWLEPTQKAATEQWARDAAKMIGYPPRMIRLIGT